MRADARRNQEKLIVVARDAFTARGMDATMDEIARRADVGPGTLYRHFPTKEALLAAVYRNDVEALSERADELSGVMTPRDALGVWLREQLDYVGHKRGLGVAIKAMLGQDSEILNWCRDTMRGALGRLLAAAQAEGSVRADVEPAVLLRLLHGIVVAGESDPSQLDAMLGVVLDGLRPQPS
jgi:AcrR family transcriptional regulator